MTLSELIAKYGDDNVKFQLLSSSLTGQAKKVAGGCQYSFLTEETLEDVVLTGKRDALIVWLDKDEMQRILQEAREAKQDG